MSKTITHDQFIQGLVEVMRTMTAEQILAIPGVYEVVSEALNNEVIDHIRAWEKVEENRINKIDSLLRLGV
jgi:predicted RecB family endonuclease